MWPSSACQNNFRQDTVSLERKRPNPTQPTPNSTQPKPSSTHQTPNPAQQNPIRHKNSDRQIRHPQKPFRQNENPIRHKKDEPGDVLGTDCFEGRHRATWCVVARSFPWRDLLPGVVVGNLFPAVRGSTPGQRYFRPFSNITRNHAFTQSQAAVVGASDAPGRSSSRGPAAVGSASPEPHAAPGGADLGLVAQLSAEGVAGPGCVRH